MTVSRFLLLIPIVLSSCLPSPSEVDKAYNAVVTEDYQFADSVIHYELFHDSLALHMHPNSLIDKWSLEISLDDRSDSSKRSVILNKSHYDVVDSRIVVSGFHLDNPSETYIFLSADPTGGKWMPFLNGELMHTIRYLMVDSSTFRAVEYWKWDTFRFDVINMKLMDSLPEKIKQSVTSRFFQRMAEKSKQSKSI